jgi:hypothetical protein
LVQAPCLFGPPRREDVHYTSVVRKSNLSITQGGLLPENMTEEREEHVFKADPPELCDAYDAWLAEYVELRKLVLKVWEPTIAAAF